MEPINLRKSFLLKSGLALAVLLGGTTIFAMQARTQTPTTSPQAPYSPPSSPPTQTYYPDDYYPQYYERRTYDYCYKQGFTDYYGNIHYVCYQSRPYQNTPQPAYPGLYNSPPSTPTPPPTPTGTPPQ